MKRVVIAISALAILAATISPLYAQTDQYLRRPHRVAISVDGGMAIPSKPGVWNDLWNTAWPFSIGATASIFSWLEVGGGLSYGVFSISEISAKPAIGIVATSEVTGGDIKMTEYYGTARFIAVPNQRTNPYAEVEVGVHRITADDIEVQGSTGPSVFPTFTNSMPGADGIHFAGGAGLRYALGDFWTAYSKFMWTVNLGNNFAPGDLVRRRGAETTEGENMQFGTVIVGIMVRI